MKSDVQNLPRTKDPRCAACGARLVKRSSYVCADGRNRIEYFVCRTCGAKARRFVEI